MTPNSSSHSLTSSNICLLDGFSRLLHFLLEAESEHFCGVPLNTHSPLRRNYRAGCRTRKIHTPIGTFLVRVPSLRYQSPHRVSISRRASRLCTLVLDSLSCFLNTDINPEDASTLIKLLWAVELPADLLDKLTAGLTPILKQWRAQVLPSPLLPTVNCKLRTLDSGLRTPTSDF